MALTDRIAARQSAYLLDQLKSKGFVRPEEIWASGRTRASFEAEHGVELTMDFRRNVYLIRDSRGSGQGHGLGCGMGVDLSPSPREG